MTPEFRRYPKIPRLCRPVVITEKLDGTCSVVHVAEDGAVTAGSRNRWITQEADHYGFARWVADHAPELRDLGPGYHYGEWWGFGIQRGYDLHEKRWSLFNVARWSETRPACCHVVPVVERAGRLDDHVIRYCVSRLEERGSLAAPGFPRPEGIVVWMEAASVCLKYTLDGDGHKGAA